MLQSYDRVFIEEKIMIKLNKIYNKFFTIIITLSVFSIPNIGMSNEKIKEKLIETQHLLSTLSNYNFYTAKRTQKSKQDFEAVIGTWVLSYNYENKAYSSKMELSEFNVRADGTEGVSGTFYLDDSASGVTFACIIPDETLNSQLGTDYQCSTAPPYRMFFLKFSGDSITKGIFAFGDTDSEVANNLASNSVPVTGTRESSDLLPAPNGEVPFDDANIIFDWAEKTYPELFAPAGVANKTQDPWYYRYYSETDTYAGVNTSNEVWVLGDVFGGMLYIDTVDNLLTLVNTPPTTDDTPPATGGGTPTTTPTSDNCVNVPFISSGLETTFTLTGGVETKPFSGEITFNYLEVTETNMRFKLSSSVTTAAGTSNTDSENFSSHTIKDNYLYISNSKGILPDGSTESETRYEPDLLSGPVLVFCEGQTWESNPVTVTSILNEGEPTVVEQTRKKGIVEAIDETITVPAGVFNTVRIRITKDDGAYDISWVSTDHGDPVRAESYNSNGSLELLRELKALKR